MHCVVRSVKPKLRRTSLVNAVVLDVVCDGKGTDTRVRSLRGRGAGPPKTTRLHSRCLYWHLNYFYETAVGRGQRPGMVGWCWVFGDEMGSITLREYLEWP